MIALPRVRTRSLPAAAATAAAATRIHALTVCAGVRRKPTGGIIVGKGGGELAGIDSLARLQERLVVVESATATSAVARASASSVRLAPVYQQRYVSCAAGRSGSRRSAAPTANPLGILGPRKGPRMRRAPRLRGSGLRRSAERVAETAVGGRRSAERPRRTAAGADGVRWRGRRTARARARASSGSPRVSMMTSL